MNKPLSFISFDVEALPRRASQDHVDRLVWGRLGGGEFGIRRICGVLEQHKIKGNFMIDFAMSALYGDKAVKEIADHLLGRGHEVHLHLHSELLIPKWALQSDRWHSMVGMDQVDGALSMSLLEFAAFKYRLSTGLEPTVFRAGSFRFNAFTCDAAARLGYKLCTNFNSERHGATWSVHDPRVRNNEPFRWSEKLAELPVDFSPEPLSHDWEMYEQYFRRARDYKKLATFNLTLHSWSLLSRRSGEYFTAYAPEHEERLHKICGHLSANTHVMGYRDFIATIPELSVDASPHCKVDPGTVSIPTRRCGICGAVYGRTLADDICPSCGSRARHRQVLDVLSRRGNLFDHRSVLACHANPIEQVAFLRKAAKLVNFDVRPIAYLNLQMDIQRMDKVEDDSFDAFMAIHVLNHVADDCKALREIHRVLKPGGVALITISCVASRPTVPSERLTAHYGDEALKRYGVGTYRQYGLDDALSMFETFFEVDKDIGVDELAGSSGFVFFLRKPTSAAN